MGDYKLSASLRGHEDDVRSVAFPHSNTVVSASRDATVRVWSLQSSGPPSFDSTIKTHGKEFINALAIVPPTAEFPNGLIVSSGKDQIIDVRQPTKSLDDAADALLIGHGANVCVLDASPDGKLIISGSWDQDARVWEVGKWGESTVLKGHTASVWAVLAYDSSTIITGCADKEIRLFTPAGQRYQSIKTGDVVRSLCKLPANHPSGAHFASAGNDAIVRLWTLEGRQVAELHGHENFIYAVAAFPDGRLVSCGEDRTARVWENQQCVQTITHPAISVWAVAVCPENGDIVTGASDKIVRVFSKDPARLADPAAIEQFHDEVKSSSIPQQQIGNINKEQLPGPEFLTQKSGTKEGQTQLIVESNGNVSAYQWSTAASQWVSIGTVVDQAGSSGRKISHNGKEYDYVFDVDIEEGKPPLKLPYNLSQNPYEVARKFCEDHKLPLTYLDQVTNFIVQNTQGQTLGQSAPAQGADPWGTESRYRPGDANPTPSSQPPPPPRPKIIPQKDYLDIFTANHQSMFKKLQEFNQSLLDEGQKGVSLNPSDIEELAAAVGLLQKGNVKDIDPGAIDRIIKAATEWPADKRLPALDFLRLLFAAEEPVAYLTTEANILERLAESGVFEITSPLNNTMMAVRLLGNLFKTEIGRAAASAQADQILAFLQPFLESTHRNLVVAVCTVHINYAVYQNREPDQVNADRTLALLVDLNKILHSAKDSEAVYRALVATGTLLSLGSDFCEAGRDILQLGSAIEAAENRVKEPRVKNAIVEIRELLKE
ncbi:phospholipase A-2-activating protein [Massarina eburnea CBS 473.64]|uniref:Phospholipase A-2-activating protein n=1 Tax=Massarina eburnea CBS 473.64 TaxID=1395130 RepID=A0A6A6RHE0_9PLEO|nr:phospholipase A-2-activating protein [Massarina eburnea CBS 473.64]